MSNCNLPAIGIDLGTTSSCVGVFLNGRVEIIANDQGNRTTPSYVAFTDTKRLIGDAAKSQVALNPENTVFDVKRLIGRKYNDPTIQLHKKYWPFTVIEEAGKPKISVQFKGERRSFTPEEISAMVINKMKVTAEAFLGQEVKDAVITVPAYFNDSQRQATKDAGKIAGLNVLRIMNEPTAAAFAYGLPQNLNGERKVLIFDLGGGTFDVSVLKISQGPWIEVLSAAGNINLGGEDFDTRLLLYFLNVFKHKFHKDFNICPKSIRRLRTACERAKRILSSSREANIQVDAIFEGNDFHSTISRARFEVLCMDLFRSILGPLEKVLKDAKVKKSDIHDVVLVGGSAHIPKIQSFLKDFFDGKDLCMLFNPAEAVVYGAAVQAAVLSSDHSETIRDLKLLDVASFFLGVKIEGGAMDKVIERNWRIPCRTFRTIVVYSNDLQDVAIEIYEGETAMEKDNHPLGMFRILDIPRTPRRIIIAFDIDANGILRVSAREASCGSFRSVTVTTDKGRLSKREIHRMLQEVKEYEKEDQMQRGWMAVRKSLRTRIGWMQQLLPLNLLWPLQGNTSGLRAICHKAQRK